MRAQDASRTLVFCALGMLVLVLSGCNRAPPQQPPPPQVEVTTPLIQDVQVWEEVTGRFAAIETVEVRPQISGRITRVHFVDGQQVKRGDLLFSIDPAEARAAADQANAQLRLAEAELARAERLRKLDAISEEEYDQRRQGAEQLRAAARATQVELNYTSVRSPIAGRVSDRRVDAGNVVQADQTVLTVVVTQSPIHFEFSIDPALAAVLPRPRPGGRDGAAVGLRLEGETDFPHTGRLDFLDVRVDPQTGVVRGRAIFENADGRFTAGQFGRLRVAREVLQNAMILPEAAISADQTRRFVLVVNDKNMVEPRPVELGPLVAQGQVVRGLDPKARVIINGGARVFPGMPVDPQPKTANSAPPAAKQKGG